MDFDTYERDLWDGRADAYQRGFARMTAGSVGPLLDAAGVGPGTRVLDVGTGPGIVSAEAVRRGASVTAVDAEPTMAATARANVPGLDVREAVLPHLPLPDAAFDAVVGNFVINHVSDPDAAVRAFARVLRPGGKLALTCWEMPPSGALSLVTEALEEAGVPFPDDIPTSPFMDLGKRGPFAALLRDAGFPDASDAELRWTHHVDPEDWWTTGALARVGTNGVIVSRQDAPTVAKIKTAYDRLATRYATPDGLLALPANALIATGTR
ncbi:class I SAM-dependent methyltransferase [Actinomadura rupiterrae]|uniref:class I SAM-dependent methyltransferase n=1 Tax=Actinomadura rupiterrae TaxID=559627 RepID=UPI0020A38AFE|nr:class I SAM-dependent methyltransferase [Actinomadura rupiterrae]MCP2338023.1 SAM-dependent methyltransferase [Actinomadura rupiterrae]